MQLIAKVLARRMAKVLKKVGEECQHVFMGGSQVLDAALIANEIVDELKYKNLEGFLCKLDMEKTYNNVN